MKRLRRVEAMLGGLFRGRINRSPIFILGNQKSGTSAIAGLLGDATGVSATLDLPGILEPVQTRLHHGELTFEKFVQDNWKDFSRAIIKEPALTLLVEALDQCFDQPRFAFVVRDPRHNIRSILNRLGTRGDLDAFDEAEAARRVHNWHSWRSVINGEWMGISHTHYIEALAERWNRMTRVYLTNRNRFQLVRYEDFLEDKEGTIRALACGLGLDPKFALGGKVNRQFQPPGDRSVCLAEFYGARNLDRVNEMCARNMIRVGYPRPTKSEDRHTGREAC